MSFASHKFLQAPRPATRNLLPTCPMQFKHPGPTLNAKSCADAPPCPTTSRQGQSLHCIFWSSTDLQTSKLCCELIFRSASISINDNAELKVLDSNRHLFFYFSLTGTVMRLDEMETQLPSCSRGREGENSFQNGVTRGPPCPLYTTRVDANRTGIQCKNQKCANCSSSSSIQATPSAAEGLLEEGHVPLGAIPLPRPPAAEKKG